MKLGVVVVKNIHRRYSMLLSISTSTKDTREIARTYVTRSRCDHLRSTHGPEPLWCQCKCIRWYAVRFMMIKIAAYIRWTYRPVPYRLSLASRLFVAHSSLVPLSFAARGPWWGWCTPRNTNGCACVSALHERWIGLCCRSDLCILPSSRYRGSIRRVNSNVPIQIPEASTCCVTLERLRPMAPTIILRDLGPTGLVLGARPI